MNYDRPAHRIDNAIATPKPLSFKFPARSKIKFALVINNTLASFPALNAVKVDLIEIRTKAGELIRVALMIWLNKSPASLPRPTSSWTQAPALRAPPPLHGEQ